MKKPPNGAGPPDSLSVNDRQEPTKEEIRRAAYAWCGQKDRETDKYDVMYFEANWWALPGLKAYVAAERAR